MSLITSLSSHSTIVYTYGINIGQINKWCFSSKCGVHDMKQTILATCYLWDLLLVNLFKSFAQFKNGPSNAYFRGLLWGLNNSEDLIIGLNNKCKALYNVGIKLPWIVIKYIFLIVWKNYVLKGKIKKKPPLQTLMAGIFKHISILAIYEHNPMTSFSFKDNITFNCSFLNGKKINLGAKRNPDFVI